MKKLFIMQMDGYGVFTHLDLVTLIAIIILFGAVIIYGIRYQDRIGNKRKHIY